MKSFLLYRDRDADRERALPPNSGDLAGDLGLQRIVEVMSAGDRFLFDAAQRELLAGVDEIDHILYRQAVLQDGLELSGPVRELFALACEAIREEGRNFWGGFRTRHASAILRRSIGVVAMFTDKLERVRAVGREHAGQFRSEGWRRFFAMMESELDDTYLERVRSDLRRVEFPTGIPMNARLGPGNRSTGFSLRDDEPLNVSWFDRLLQRGEPGYTFELHPRDESGARMLSELGDRGVNLVADALAQAADHMLAFFTTLRYEVGFYVAALNLHDALREKGAPTCFPQATPPNEPFWTVSELYDPSLALSLGEPVVTNDAFPAAKPALVITGANRGGKSTFLRGIGAAQLMLQCGMFVPAASMRASLSTGLFTHYKREEDETMESGKFDEELRRMNAIVERLRPGAMVLMNESFASTNEREGSEIAFQIVTALIDSGVRVALVTHLYELGRRLAQERSPDVYFLRAERGTDGQRTFKLMEGPPLPTSYGTDLYRLIVSEETTSSRRR